MYVTYGDVFVVTLELPSASSSSQNGIVNMLLSLVCGAACKDTPLAQVFGKDNDVFFTWGSQLTLIY